MKPIAIFLSFLMVTLFLFGADVKNEDKPLRGEWDFQRQEVWGVDKAGDDDLVEARSITVDDKGNIYAMDSKHHKFFVYNPQGKFLYSFGKQGEGPGEYKFAFNFFLVGQYLIVPDQGKFHYFKPSGEYVKSYNSGASISPLNFVDEHRFLMIPFQDENKRDYDQLEIYDLLTREHLPIARIGAEEALTASGKTGQGQMVLRLKISNATPGVVVAVHRNTLIYGKNDRYLIKKTDLEGKELLSFSLTGRKRQEIPMAYKKNMVGKISLNGGKIPDELAKQIIDGMPDFFTYFSRISCEEDGLIYVYLSGSQDDTQQEIDIFSPQGQYLYHAVILLPEGLKRITPFVIKGSNLVVFVEDNEGERKLVKYKISKPTL